MKVFKVIPNTEFVLSVLPAYGLSGFADARCFCRKDLEKRHIVEVILDKYLGDFALYYRPYKFRDIFTTLTVGKCVTILKHLLYEHGYMLENRSTVVAKRKIIMYSIQSRDKLFFNIERKNRVLSFD